MWRRDLNFDIDVLKECQKEFVPVNKQQFLQTLIMNRLEDLNKEQLAEFDTWLQEVNDFVDSDKCDMVDLSRIVKKLSRYSKQICNVELTLFMSLLGEE